MIDSFNRKIVYLRVSVTDHCNLRCLYCLPETYNGFTPFNTSLTNDEFVTLISYFSECGISKIRITGGEPLLRPGIENIISGISKISAITDIALSTNGILLCQFLPSLAKAGLKRINISLDSLKAGKFKEITRQGNLENVMNGIEKALQSCISPVKINVVVSRGINDDEIEDFIKLTVDRPLHVRFIELMPMGEIQFFNNDKCVPLNEMIEKSGQLDPLPHEKWPAGYGPAQYYRRPNAKGTVGFISALSSNFCSSCNRIRLSNDGIMFPCLDDTQGTNLKIPIRSGASKEDIINLIKDTVERKKPERHFMLERAANKENHSSPRFMCQIGG